MIVADFRFTRIRSKPKFKASVSARMDIVSRVRRLAENTALASWMQGLVLRRIVYRQEPNQCRENKQAATKKYNLYQRQNKPKTIGVASLPSACSLRPMPKLMSLSQKMNPPKRKNAEEASAFDVSYKVKIRIEHERRTIGSHLRHS